MLSKDFFCPVPFKIMKMKNLSTLTALSALIFAAGCGKIGKSHKGLPDDGQLHGVSPAGAYNLSKPPGMVYIPPGTFHVIDKLLLAVSGWMLRKSLITNTASSPIG
jgi:hypothetical protein